MALTGSLSEFFVKLATSHPHFDNSGFGGTIGHQSSYKSKCLKLICRFAQSVKSRFLRSLGAIEFYFQRDRRELEKFCGKRFVSTLNNRAASIKNKTLPNQIFFRTPDLQTGYLELEIHPQVE
jgi:hypothetical protein